MSAAEGYLSVGVVCSGTGGDLPPASTGGGVICASGFLYNSLTSQCESAVRGKHGDFTA